MTEKSERLLSRFPVIMTVSVVAFVGSAAVLEIAEDMGFLAAFLCKSNIIKYAFSLFVFALTFVVSCIVSWTIPVKGQSIFNRELKKKTYRRLLLSAILVVGALLLHRRFFAEVNDFAIPMGVIPLHLIPLWCALPLTVATALAALAFSRGGRDISSRWVVPGYLAAVGLTFAASLVLDPFRGDLYHGVAYLESIYNVLHEVPYTLETTGIYGHYALFLAPVLRLVGSNSLAVMLLMSALLCCSAALCIYCIHHLIAENWLRILGAFACCMCLITLRTSNYWQLHPHRVLFPLLVCAWLVFLTDKNRWGIRELLASWLLSAAAVLWNTESGIFCAISLSAAFLVHDLQARRWYQPEMLLRYVLHIILIIGSVVAAIGVMNVYNYLCGHRTPEISSFFFPMGVSDYMDGVLRCDLTVENDAWVYVLILFSALLLVGLSHTSIFVRKAGSASARYAPLCAAVAMLGLLSFSYYANRAAYCNLDIIFQLACIAMCLFWRLFSDAWKSEKEEPRTLKRLSQAVTSAVCLAVMAVLAMQSIVFAGVCIRRNADAGHYNTQTLREICDTWQANVPEDTYAFGTGVSIIYEELGWDPGGRYRDMPDFFVGEDMLGVIVDEALEHDSFAVLHLNATESTIIEHILAWDPSYRLALEIPFSMQTPLGDSCVLMYFTRNP